MIFCFSAKNADQSRNDSMGLGYRIAKVLYQDFDTWNQEKQEMYIESIQYPIRKGAHASEYTVLGILILGTFVSYYYLYEYKGRLTGKRINRGLAAWLTGSVYACTDEFHQLFVPGRSGEIKDVMIDSTGVLAGVLLLSLLLYWINCRNCRNNR